MNPSLLNRFLKSFLILFLLMSGLNNSFTQGPGYTANDQVTPYDGPFHYGTNMGYYPGYTDGQVGDLAAGNPNLNIPGIGATTLRPGLFEHYLDQFGYEVNIPWFQHFESLGLKDHTMFVGYPSANHQDPNFHCAGTQSTVFDGMYLPIWDGGANGTPVNDDNYYALFLYKMVTLYKPYIKFWEIWNEPDLDFSPNGMGWRFPGDPEGSWWDDNPDPCHIQLAAPIFYYNRLLRISYEVIKSIDPDAYVTVGGLGFPSFLDAIMRNTDNPVDGSVTAEYPLKGGAYFDVLSFHSYPHINGSLLIWDPINGVTGYQRHSDAAIKGITEDLNDFKVVMNQYGYNGNTFPEKEVIMTESSIPRKKFGDYIGSEEAALNYAIKLPIELQKEGVLHFHYYDLGEKEDFDNAIYPFQVTGFYEKLVGTPVSDIQRTNQGLAYKTVSNLLFEKTYDPVATAALNLPATIDGGAFKDSNGEYTYALWAVCQTDDSEVSSATYSFPAGTFQSNISVKAWDFSVTGQESITSSQNVALGGSPLFIAASNVPLSVNCPVDINHNVAANQNGDVISWNPPTGSTNCNAGSNLNITQTGGPSNGSFLPVGTSTITYEISDNCGNIETCSFNVIITQNPPIGITCANGQHELTINVIGNGSVNIEYVSPAGNSETCSTGTCVYCVNSGTLLKLVGLPNQGETFLGWTSGGCNGTNDCWKSINWETEITANFTTIGGTGIELTTTPSDVSCNGNSDGSIALNVTGGSGSYSYSWSSGQTTPNLTNVAAGSYVVTVTDSNGESEVASATINEPLALVGFISSSSDISCSGMNDGSATADANGGEGNYQYAWSNNSTSSSINNLSPGDYTVTISDSNGCTATATTTILNSTATTPVSDFSKTINMLDVSFTDISSGNPTSWLWEFGDGTTSTNSNATHTYASAGTYLACLMVSNDCGENISCQNISVGQTNNLDIILESVVGNPGTIVQVPIRINNFENVVSFQHSFIIPDTSKAVFVGTSNLLTAQLGNGTSISFDEQTVNTVWLTTNGIPTSLIDGTALYYLDILIKGGPNDCVDVLLNEQNFPTEFVVIEGGNVVQVGFNITDGEVCASPGVVVTGHIATEAGLDILDVEVVDTFTFITYTDFNGDYEFPPANSGSSFYLKPQKDTNYVNGVTSFDLAIIQQHILGNVLLDSPYKIIAADIDHDNIVTSFDLSLAQQVIINMVDTFPNNESWRFVPTDYVFPDPTNPFSSVFPEHIELTNLSTSPTSQDFIAIKVGDVNQTALPDALDGGSNALTRESETQLNFLIQEDKTSSNEYYVDFLAKDFENMSAFQFELLFNPKSVEFDRVEQTGLDVNYGNKLLQEGILSFIWFDKQGLGQNLKDNNSLFRIYFKPKNILSPNAMDLSIVNTITPPVAYDFYGNPSTINFSFLSKQESIKSEVNASIIVLQNEPNPFSLISKIKFKMVIEDLVQVSVTDQHGGSIFATQEVFPAGNHQIDLKASDFPSSGIYYYTFTTSTDRVVRKMVVLQ